MAGPETFSVGRGIRGAPLEASFVLPPPIFPFSSETLGPGSRFDAHRDLSASGCDVVRTSDRFQAAVSADRFDRTLVFECRLSGVGHLRDAARVRRDGFEHLSLYFLISGDLTAPMGAERPGKPGEIVVVDSSMPHRNLSDGAHTITVSLARDQIGAMVPDLRPFHGTVLSKREAGAIADPIASDSRPDSSEARSSACGA